MKDIFMTCLQPAGELMLSQLMKATEANLNIKVCQISASGSCERNNVDLSAFVENSTGWRIWCIDISAKLS